MLKILSGHDIKNLDRYTIEKIQKEIKNYEKIHNRN